MDKRIYPLLALLITLGPVLADTFTCEVTLNGRLYQISELYGFHNLTRTVFMTPSQVVQDLSFDLCEPLEVKEDTATWDQCPEGTRACLIEYNRKGNDPDRLSRVIPIATDDVLDVTVKAISGDQGEGLNLVMHGPTYPPAKDEPPKEVAKAQVFDIDILCPPSGGESEAPSFASYDGSLMKVKWKHRVVCPGSNSSPPPSKNPKSKKVGSGIGYFFLVLFIAFLSYFALGAYYNYNNYGAAGWDLIPHRDFWREAPYLIRDLFSHLCSLGRSRRGYVQV